MSLESLSMGQPGLLSYALSILDRPYGLLDHCGTTNPLILRQRGGRAPGWGGGGGDAHHAVSASLIWFCGRSPALETCSLPGSTQLAMTTASSDANSRINQILTNGMLTGSVARQC